MVKYVLFLEKGEEGGGGGVGVRRAQCFSSLGLVAGSVKYDRILEFS